LLIDKNNRDSLALFDYQYCDYKIM